MIKETGEALSQRAVDHLRTVNGHELQIQDVNLRVAKISAEHAQGQVNAQWENLRAAESNLNTVPTHLQDLARQAREHTIGSQVVARQIHSAQHEQQQDFAGALLANEALQREAGGISEHGADSSLAAAIASTRKAYNDAVGEAVQVTKHFNLSSAQRQDLAKGVSVTATDSAGNVRTFTEQDIYAREAVIDEQVRKGTVKEAQELVALSGSTLKQFRTTIGDAVAEGGLGNKTVYAGGATIDLIKRGEITSPAMMTGIIQDNIAKGKFSADKLVTMDKDAVAYVLAAAREKNTGYMTPGLVKDLNAAVQALKGNADYALTDSVLKGRVSNNVKPLLEDIKRLP